VGRKSRKTGRNPGQPATKPPTASRRDTKPAFSGGRKWLFRLAGLVLVPLLLLGGFELALRLAGYGFRTSFFKKMDIGGQQYWVDNDTFGFRFFPPALARIPAPVVMKAKKPPGSIRIFIFGESAALGDPQPHYGAGRYLETLLRARYPETSFEVVNTAMIAINSHVILPIARECAGHKGDLWIVYMGNNEMVGPFGAATVFGQKAPPLALVRLNLAIQHTRVGQLLLAFSHKLHKSNESSWRGMEMFLENKTPPDDPRKEVVYRNYSRNLEDILQAGTDAGAKIILSTVAVNLKDCPPFASLPDTELPAADRASYDSLHAAGAAALDRRDWPAAEQSLAKAVALFPRSADAQYLLAKALLHETNDAPAREHFEQAVEDDLLPFRTDSRINGLIRTEGARFAEHGLVVSDAVAALTTNSTTGIPGADSFYEHVHLNFDGNYRLAHAWAEAAEKALQPQLPNKPQPAWATQEQCERMLGLTDWNRLSVLEEVIGREKQPPLSSQSNDGERLAAMQDEMKMLRQRMTDASKSAARQVYLEALRGDPENYRLHEAFAEFLEQTDDYKEAAGERQKVRDLIPHFYFSHFKLGLDLKQLGQVDEARNCLRRAAELNPQRSEIRIQLGEIYARQNQWEKAANEYALAYQLSPDNARILLYQSEVLWKLGRHAESIGKLREALRLHDDFWEAHYRLGEHLATAEQINEAAAEFATVVRLNPTYIKARLNLGVALAKMGRAGEAAEQFDEVLRLDPQNKEALGFKGTRGR
jgi:tetratricopeptide (TPR) repeat protein